MIHKLHISLKEASETKYWLKLLFKSNFIEETPYRSMLAECEELIKILTSIINTLKAKSK